MTSVWAESVGRSLEAALDLLAAAVEDCTEPLWETAMWQVSASGSGEPGALIQRHAMPWGVAWHALEVLDYDLNGEFGPWAPPPPFAGHPHWRDLTLLPVAWSRSEILTYIGYCQERVRSTLAEMTGERAATPLPSAHRYSGQPHARVIASLAGHTTEHASQIRQFTTAAGVIPSAR
jgi:hypothetical protein